MSFSGNVQPQLDVLEHSLAAKAKRAQIVGLSDSGSDYVTPTVFEYANSNPLAVVLVDTNGDAYVASSGGGPSSSVTAYIAASVTLFTVSDVTFPDSMSVTGTVTANVAFLPEISGTVTAHIAASVTLFTVSQISTLPDPLTVSGTVTANIAVLPDPVNVSGTVTSNVAVLPPVSGTVTANVAVLPLISGTVTSNVASGTVTANVAVLPSITGTVTSHVASAVATLFGFRGKYVPVTGPVSLPEFLSGEVARYGLILRADPTNTETIYIGFSNVVTSGRNNSNSGMPLSPGDTLQLPLLDSTLVWVVGGGTATQHISLGGV